MIHFIVLRPMRNDARYEYVPWKNIWFCFISIVRIHFGHRSEKFWIWKSLKYLIFLDKKLHNVRFEYVPWSNAWFCFISIDWAHFCYKREKFQFWWNTLIFFYQKNTWCQLWICPVKQCLIWFKRRYWSMILALSWEIWVLNFIEIFS